MPQFDNREYTELVNRIAMEFNDPQQIANMVAASAADGSHELDIINNIQQVLQAHPAVRDAAVRAITVGAQTRFIAGVVFRPEAVQISTGTLTAYIHDEIDANTDTVQVVAIDRIDRTADGEIEEAKIALALHAAVVKFNTTPPRTWIERRIFDIWVELLGFNDFGVEDGFLELGGHSLLGMKALSRIHDIFGVDLPLTTMFQKTLTVATLADEVERALIEKSGLDPNAALESLRSLSEKQIEDLLRTMQQSGEDPTFNEANS